MRIAKNSDKERVKRILAQAFKDNPSVNFIVRPSLPKNISVERIAEYAFNYAYKRGGVYLSDDGEGVMIFYETPTPKTFLSDYWGQLRLLLTALALKKMGQIMRRDAFIHAKRREQSPAIYVWFWGVSDAARGSRNVAMEMRDFIFDYSEKRQLPILLETSLRQGQAAYARYGFKTYFYWDNSESGVNLWFMKREVEQRNTRLF